MALAACSLIAAAAPAQANDANAASLNNSSSPPVITTAAGNGQFGFSGDGGAATAAKLALPTGAVEDVAGNVYFDDTFNNRVRRISTAGTITTVAGNGSAGFSGDGGQAKSAQLCYPAGVAVDSSGNLYIADTGNNRVRKVTSAGLITTVAGSGGNCSSSRSFEEAARAKANISVTAGFRAQTSSTTNNNNGGCALSGNGGPATSAQLCAPTGVAVDGASLYIADGGNNEIRKVTGGTITAYAGTGTAGSSGDGGPANVARLNAPVGVSVDAVHMVYIADSGNNKVRRVNTAGIISTFAGTGPSGYGGDGNKAVLALLDDPTGMGIDSLGNVYITDSGNCRIRVVIPKGDIFTYAGNGQCGYSGDGGPATAAKINVPLGSVAVDANDIYFGDTGNERVRRVQGGPPPNIPEVPYLAVLPLSAIALMAGAWLVTRRRHGGTPHHIAA